MRHYATIWNVAGSIPNEVIGFFINFPNPSSRTMATKRNGYQESYWRKVRSARKADLIISQPVV
jgi:hypothetical protein